MTATARAETGHCRALLRVSSFGAPMRWVKAKAIEQILFLMSVRRGLPKYVKQIKETARTGAYKKKYDNFGHMGLAEIGISLRYNKARFAALDTGRPLIIVANHHLGIADGLAMQYLASAARTNAPSLLFLARWIEKLLPFAVYTDANGWGTAVPVEINMPKPADPDYETKLGEVKLFNGAWGQKAFRNLRSGGALIVFPAGHVASVVADEAYPRGVKDDPESWQDGFLSLARLTKAQIVFANVDAVNSEAFYRDRKRFGGGDMERVIWFLSEALAKKGKVIDVHLSPPMDLADVYTQMSLAHGHSVALLKADPPLTAELMRQWVYRLPEVDAQPLDTTVLPQASLGSSVETHL